MKKALSFVLPGLILVLIVGLLVLFVSGKGISTGYCLVTERGDYLIILDNAPVVMGNRTGRENAFGKLETGDRIWILHDGIQETYPGKTGVYLIVRTGDGAITDIPEQVLNSLRELGWIS